MNIKSCSVGFFGFFGCVVLSACMDIRAVDRDQAEGNDEKATTLTQTANVTAAPYVEVLPGPHLYQVLIPVDREFGEVVIQRTGPDKVKQQLVLNSSHHGAIDEKVVPGATYIYQWGHQTTTLTIPVDFEVKGEMDPSQKEVAVVFEPGKKWGRVWFHPKAVLTTLGRDLDLQANQLMFADGAVLRTFSADQRAAMGANGRSGGRLRLMAKKATGTLTLELRGEHGGVGRSGADTKALAQYGGRFCEGSYCVNRYNCASTTPSAGASGERGGHGGSTPQTNIDILDVSELNLQILTEPGFGGQGGRGGLGGAPPVASSPMNLFERDEYVGCHAGTPGAEGHPGESGTIQTICRRQGTEMNCGR